MTSNENTSPVWFITGCSTGFGRELSRQLLERGDRVVVTARNPASVDDLARMHHVFPTFGEGVKAAAEQALPQPVEMATICN